MSWAVRAVRERELHSTAKSLTRIDPGEGGRSDIEADRMFLNRNLDMNNTIITDIEEVDSDESARDISQQGTRRNSTADDPQADEVRAQVRPAAIWNMPPGTAIFDWVPSVP